MNCHRGNLAAWTALVGLAVAASSSPFASAQVVVQDGQNQAWTGGATTNNPLASFMDAQAQQAVALGMYEESIARARIGHAEAYAKELENEVLKTETWIERKTKNREYRQALNPNYADRQARQTLATRRRIEEQHDDIARGDLTPYMNWLLDQLAATEFGRYRGAVDSQSMIQFDRALSPEDVKHIVMTDGGRTQGQKLTFRANDGRVLTTRWPLALRDDQFKEEREHFEEVRDDILQHLARGGELKPEQAERLRQAYDGLEGAFYGHFGYPRTEVGKENRLKDYASYRNGRRYLDALALALARAIETNDARIFDGSYAFKGQSVRELVWHMCERGAQFAPPESGDEGTYVKLFHDMRYLYLNILAQTNPAEQASFD
jgi:hypothetical protein